MFRGEEVSRGCLDLFSDGLIDREDGWVFGWLVLIVVFGWC